MNDHAANGPLAGRKVVVTRSAEQADDLAILLEQHGAVAVVVPLIDIEPLPEADARLAALRPADFDWLVVTSPNGARAFTTHHRSAPLGVAAMGTTTARTLADGGTAVTLVPQHQNTEGLLDEFPTGTGTVLVVQADGADPDLTAGLGERGWQVTVVAPYRSVPTRPSPGTQLAALSADAVLFASGSAARAWTEVFGTSGPPITVAIGPRCAQAAEAAGLKITLIAADHSLVGLVQALGRYLSVAK
jgi:uroporphyrinogen-III synthase